MSRRPDHLGKRKDFSQKIKQQARERANWTCEYPGCDNSAQEVDHILAEGLGGKSSLQNAQVLCEFHHKQKTKLDQKMMVKADKQGGRIGQYARRKKNGPQLKSRNTLNSNPNLPQRADPWGKKYKAKRKEA